MSINQDLLNSHKLTDEEIKLAQTVNKLLNELINTPFSNINNQLNLMNMDNKNYTFEDLILICEGFLSQEQGKNITTLILNHQDYIRIFGISNSECNKSDNKSISQDAEISRARIKKFKRILENTHINAVFLNKVDVSILLGTPLADFVTGLAISSSFSVYTHNMFVNPGGILTTQGNLNIQSDSPIEIHGQIIVNGQLSLQALNINNNEIVHNQGGASFNMTTNDTELFSEPHVTSIQKLEVENIQTGVIKHIKNDLNRMLLDELEENLKIIPNISTSEQWQNYPNLTHLKIHFAVHSLKDKKKMKIPREIFKLASQRALCRKISEFIENLKDTHITTLHLVSPKLLSFDSSELSSIKFIPSKKQNDIEPRLSKYELIHLIAEALVGSPIQQLILQGCFNLLTDYNKTDEATILNFFEILLLNTGIQELDISLNPIFGMFSPAGIKRFGEIISQSELSVLKMSNCCPNNLELSMLLYKSLLGSTKLRTLILSNDNGGMVDKPLRWQNALDQEFEERANQYHKKAQELIAETFTSAISSHSKSTFDAEVVTLIFQYANLKTESPKKKEQNNKPAKVIFSLDKNSRKL